MIENFSLLSPEGQKQFAADLVAKLNEQMVFSDEVDFEIFDIEANEMDGSLNIGVSVNTSIDRDAAWQCGDSDEASSTPSDYDFSNLDKEDAKQAFKTLTAEFEGYTLELSDLEIDDEDVEAVSEVYDVTNEDAGIGHYEFWGETGYDSQPYCEVEGALAVNCSISAWLIVTPK
jgi:hypothetical protein